MASIKAVSASNLALKTDIKDGINFDRVVWVLKQTGDDLKMQYKETALGGLAHEYQNFDE